MADAEKPPRAALYVDFDNVFMALLRWDERAAYAFGERPDAWLAWLEGREEGGAPTTRRTLIRRCYLNPGGYFDFQMGRAVARYRQQRDLRNRTWFGEFRANFVQAGFDIVDCPPVAYLKNSADMKMALDIRDALDHKTTFDEFVILSGDSDFLPALARLRAHDRRITILAQNTAKRAYLAAADIVVGLDDFAHEGMGNVAIAQVEQSAPRPEPARPEPARAEPARPEPARPEQSRPEQSRADHPRPEPVRAEAPPARAPDLPGLRAAALAWLREALARSPAGALRMTEVGSQISRQLPALKSTAYAGAGSLGGLIEEARDPRLLMTGPASRRWVFDPERGPPPGDLPPGIEDQPGLSAEAQGTAEDAPDAPAEAAPSQAEIVESPPVGAAEPGIPVDNPPEPEPSQPAAPPVVAEEPAPSPEPEREPEQEPEPPSREALMAEAALLVRDLLWGSRDNKGLAQDLPAFAPAEIGFVLNAIAARQPLEMAEMPAAAAAIAADAAAQGLHVSAREVTAILRWLLRGFARLQEAPPPDAAAQHARRLYATLVAAVRAVDEPLSEAEKEALRNWTQAGMAQGIG
ncbi:MAG: NYN domain-containing protein [Roseomonas sp.]|nr:NYN domain-containing protein [Roseomonas sp.]